MSSTIWSREEPPFSCTSQEQQDITYHCQHLNLTWCYASSKGGGVVRDYSSGGRVQSYIIFLV